VAAKLTIVRFTFASRENYPACPQCAREGHRVFVLTATYPVAGAHQFSIRRERVAEVRRWLENCQRLRRRIESICEMLAGES